MPLEGKSAETVHTLVFNCLSEQIAVIDRAGTIVDVNSSWTDFGIENGLSPDYVWNGKNYFHVLSASHAGGDLLAKEAADGILSVVNGQCSNFYLEYPCHSPEVKRWFVMQVNYLKDYSQQLYAISHHDITRRKLAEEQAEHLAMHDPLTGLANRRYFSRTLRGEFGRSKRFGSPISLIAVDIDRFKPYNDECGHLAGDYCLIQLGRVLDEFSRRPSDLAARLGGDEFALLLGSTDSAEAQRIAAAILTSFDGLGIVFGGGSQQVTASAGVASVIAHRGQHEGSLMHEADRALYRAKQAGRNRVVTAVSITD